MNSKQYVEVPTSDLRNRGLEMKDVVIYAYLKKHYNSKTQDSFPSLDTLVRESGISKPTIIKGLERLVNSNYIQITKYKKVNHYTFSSINTFQIYSFDFLDDPNLDTNDKAYIICMQPYLKKNKELGIGKTTYSDLELAQKLGIDLRTFRKYESHISTNDKNILTIVPTKKKDPQTGLMVQERIFNFEAYNNLLALKFNEIDERLDNTVSKDDYNELKKDYNKLLQAVVELQKQVNTQEVQEIIL